LLAFGLATRLGVDVEQLSERNVTELAPRVFSPSEYGAFLALPDAIRRRVFFDAWTRKEAIVKALGGGLAIPLDGPEVVNTCAPEWSVRNIEMGDDFAAAVAVRARRIDLRSWDWTFNSAMVAALDPFFAPGQRCNPTSGS
jgi:4'-phosphopantetheinyl transferase